MRKIATILFSPRTSLVLLLLFTISIAVATFVEDRHDTVTAQVYIYNAWWFELILGLMALNFLGNLRRYHFFTPGKLGGFLFHMGFVVLIAGAAITRYFGFEGSMHIREGESTNVITSEDPYLQVLVKGPSGEYKQDHKLLLTAWGDNSFSYKINTGKEEPVRIKFRNYLQHAEEVINENIPGGTDMIGIEVSSPGGSQGVYLKKGERVQSGSIYIGFADSLHENEVNIEEVNGQLVATGKTVFSGKPMGNEAQPGDSVLHGQMLPFYDNHLYQYAESMFALIRFYRNAEIDFVSSKEADGGMQVLTVDVRYNGRTEKAHLLGASIPENPAKEINFGDLKVFVKYGPREMKLPFKIQLRKFELDRYAGSMSPSSFASEVTVMDEKNNKRSDYRIFMNHVLDYRGYRFFQSSYDTDEKGTILSVNHDFWGTWVSYISYLILFIGFVLALFSKHSRYHFLSDAIRKVRQRRKALLAVLLLLLTTGAGAQHKENHIIPVRESEKFGRTLVQTFDGRIEPLHTLAYDALHKIARKDRFEQPGKESLDAMQLMIDLLADPAFWKAQKIIYIREESVADLLGISGRYAAFNDFLDAKGQYKIGQQVEESFHKKPGDQNRFDKELLKVDERVNLFFSLLQGSMIKIFPASPSSPAWVDWTDSLSSKPLGGGFGILAKELQMEQFTYNNLMTVYLQSLMAGAHSGSFEKADRVLGIIQDIQRNNILAKSFPSVKRVEMEIRYNKQHIFNKLRNYYFVISLLFLLFAMLPARKITGSKAIKWTGRLLQLILLPAFIYHSYGMIFRWYLSGHAPWSNGYEALLLVAWSAIFAGLFFVRSSLLVQAATAFLAGMVLMTAGHSNYDPQLTNLQPVLQSYWLIIHVAVITISYGFLGLGFILGTINLFLYLLKNGKNSERMNLLITELTFINEKNLQIGLFLATLGTFLGGVWASESWGRYWGWDAKETWALVIVIVYSIVLHLRLVPRLRSLLLFNAASVFSFGSVLMTFIGVNYYLSKGLHSYASDDKSVFPFWGWLVIIGFVLLVIAAWWKERNQPGRHSGNHPIY